MTKISHSHVIYEMNADNPPAAKVSPGKTVKVETKDVFGNQITSDQDRIQEIDRSLLHPATGPIYIEGAEPGDVLKINIEKISLESPAVQGLVPNFGLLGEDYQLHETKIFPVSDNSMRIGDISLPLNPMIGTIGVAPPEKSIPCNSPGNHGGNMDTRFVTTGATLLLPVFVKGALLTLGDVHARQGDGEVSGISAEVSATVKMKILIKESQSIEAPQIRYQDRIITLGSADNLNQAAKKAVRRMIETLSKEYPISKTSAYMLCTLVGDLAISQIVNPLKTARFTINRELIAGLAQ